MIRFGTPNGNEFFFDDSRRETIFGLGGDDTFAGIGANDRAYGGPGDDDFTLSEAITDGSTSFRPLSAYIFGGPGEDTVTYDTPPDTIDIFFGLTTLYWGSSDTTVYLLGVELFGASEG
ncbi:hypothetical protein [Acuticoccus sp. I52.16.1]|uniref:hypothetical protein n=1 Tax=Acuticoccus sp. I52.16.1 TaxID=2928472 RepID=UPI001FD49221|nr:hypothetical protein [Acuticoccus sp. I52.16.1]UOM34849.1 hypothetical protein MRB58_01140 [Acuticoccus sp. I52.16.1]